MIRYVYIPLLGNTPRNTHKKKIVKRNNRIKIYHKQAVKGRTKQINTIGKKEENITIYINRII